MKRHRALGLHNVCNFPMYNVQHDINKSKIKQRAIYRAPEYNVPPFLTDRPGRPSCFSDQPEKKNTSLVEDDEEMSC